MLVAAGCHRGGASGAAPFDANAFIVSTANLALSDADLGDQAAHRAHLPETKQLGAAVAAEQRALLAALAPIAQRRKIAMPVVLEDRRAALHQNLSLLSGDLFDQGWALAMTQDYDAMLGALSTAARSDDELRAFAARVRPTLIARRKSVAALLSHLGGSPFNVGS